MIDKIFRFAPEAEEKFHLQIGGISWTHNSQICAIAFINEWKWFNIVKDSITAQEKNKTAVYIYHWR